MGHHESRGPRIRFTPARLKARHDGWSAERQRRFIATLEATRSVTRACAAAGMTRMSAYRLRARPEAADFALAWKAAVAFDSSAPRRRSPRALQRLARMADRAAKGDETHEMHTPPDSFSSEAVARHVRHLRHLRERAATR